MFSASIKILAGFLALGLVLGPHPARAAFKLIAPPKTGAAAEAQPTITAPTEPVVIAAPTAPVQAAPLPSGSVLETGRPAKTADLIPLTMTAPAPQPVPVAMPLPPKSELLASARQTLANASVSVAPASSDTVKGFGKNIPLHTALRQIAPQGFEFGFGAGVNPAQTVSWQGGQNWRDVLSSSLQKQGLTYRETGSLIYVQRTGTAAVPVSVAQPVVQPVAQPVAMSQPVFGPSDAMYRQAVTQPLPPVSASNFNPPMTVAMNAAPPEAPIVINDSGDRDVAVVTKAETVQVVTEEVAQPASVQTVSVPVVETVQTIETISATNSSVATPLAQSRSWHAKPGSTLRSTLQQWCDLVNADLTWDAEYDYPVQAPVHVDGTFDDAVRAMLKGFEKANPPPKGNIFTGQGQQAVLVITAPGNDYTN